MTCVSASSWHGSINKTNLAMGEASDQGPTVYIRVTLPIQPTLINKDPDHSDRIRYA